ncbi:unnamed protein product [Linum tenue]|uniref:Uncharacterized protein n=1 Tax=Linum tenue TaxID=586396 RepID=A0AAV0N9H8_9ROSI|nr:unnamed protein product [Linum tenue]CAI0456329.1 unnamed protein product [Linum tenue]
MALTMNLSCMKDIAFPKQVFGPVKKAINFCDGTWIMFPSSEIHLSVGSTSASSAHLCSNGTGGYNRNVSQIVA